ncbi:class I SAM-dependent methyltransferase [Candidatus Poseidoniaceae archaeon]|nr:class I SAM-dependent methyltransferase [Candidatus Poseidoniaceae archaeon]
MRFAPEKTAINRMGRDGNPKMTMPTRFLLENGPQDLLTSGIFLGRCRVLDFGAGKSFDAQLISEYFEPDEDLEHSLDVSYEGVSYDPYPREGFEDRSESPKGKFQLVVCNFVLNVLETEEQRQEVIQQVFSFLNTWNYAMFSVRSDSEINKKNYETKVSEDTFISKKTKEWYTVQKGFSESELVSFIKEAMKGQGHVRHIPLSKKPSKDCTMVLFQKNIRFRTGESPKKKNESTL